MPNEVVTPVENELNEVSILAIHAKDDPALMADLWDAVQNLIKLWAYRYAQRGIAEQGTRSFDTDDLIQSGYFAVVKAVAGYEPDKGFAFTSYLNFHIRTQFAEVAGRRGKQRTELETVSLDTPISDDGDACMVDMLADPNAEFEDEMLAQDALQQDCAALLEEIYNLPDQQRQALTLTACDGLTAVAAAKVMGCSDTNVKHHADRGAAAVRNTTTGRRIREDYFPIRHVGLNTYKSTFTSSVEWAVLWREERGLLKL